MVQIVETTNEGLKRAYSVTIPANVIAEKIEAEVKTIAPQVQLPGFRPGKVPANLVKKRFGAQVHQDVLMQPSARRWTRWSPTMLRPATQPDVRWAKAMRKARMPR
jgi:trigger factor